MNSQELEFYRWLIDTTNRFNEIRERYQDFLKELNPNLQNNDFVINFESKITNNSVSEDTEPLNEDTIEFARSTMNETEFNLLFPKTYNVIISYRGKERTVDNINKLTITQSSFNYWFELYCFKFVQTRQQSINQAGHMLFNYYKDWVKKIFQ